VIAMVSGGKDSTAMALWLLDTGIQFRAVFFDGGWEHPDTLAYIDGPLAAAIGPIEVVRPQPDFLGLVRRFRHFPGGKHRWCSSLLKAKPTAILCADLTDPVVAIGIRSRESAARADLPMWDRSHVYDAEVFRPVLNFTFRDVVEIHQRHGLRPNPLYLRGATRVGCWPCVFANKYDLRLLAQDAERVELIRSLESEITEARGRPVAMFAPKIGGDETPWPIDRVLEWACKPGHDKRELFGRGERIRGCSKWGLCDATVAHGTRPWRIRGGTGYEYGS